MYYVNSINIGDYKTWQHVATFKKIMDNKIKNAHFDINSLYLEIKFLCSFCALTLYGNQTRHRGQPFSSNSRNDIAMFSENLMVS